MEGSEQKYQLRGNWLFVACQSYYMHEPLFESLLENPDIFWIVFLALTKVGAIDFPDVK